MINYIFIFKIVFLYLLISYCCFFFLEFLIPLLIFFLILCLLSLIVVLTMMRCSDHPLPSYALSDNIQLTSLFLLYRPYHNLRILLYVFRFLGL